MSHSNYNSGTKTKLHFNATCRKCGTPFDTQNGKISICPACGADYTTLHEPESKLTAHKHKMFFIPKLNFAKYPPRSKRNKTVFKICSILTAVAFVLILGILIWRFYLSDALQYREATKMLESKQYEQAISLFNELNDFKDSPTKILECQYRQATDYLNAKEYETAKSAFEALGDYKDSKQHLARFKTVATKIIPTDSLSSTYEYNDKGWLIKTSIPGFMDSVMRDTEYIYDENGKLLKETTTSPYDDASSNEYEYDENGRLCYKISTLGSTSVQSVYEYVYNNDGLLVKMVCTSSFGETTADEYEYNANGLMTKRIFSHGDTIVYEYNDLNQISKKIYTSIDDVQTTEYEYNEDGLVVKETDTFTSDMFPTCVTEYQYNEEGFVEKESAYEAERNLRMHNKYLYEYELIYETDNNLEEILNLGV